ncbi:unnamed protein product [Lota lota]
MEASARHLRFQLYTQDESHVIENAVTSAIHALLDAIYSVNCDKIVKYQSIVEDRDKEISRLECKLRQNELELRVVRGQRDGYRRLAVEGQGSVATGHGCKDGYEVPAGDDAMTNGLTVQTDFTSGSAGRPPSLPRVDDDHTTAPYSLHKRSGTRDHSDAIAHSPGDRVPPVPPRPLVKKEEEPSGCEAFFIKLEMCEQSCGSGQQGERQRPDRPSQSPATQSRRLTDAERNKRYRQRCRSTPEGLRACREKERLRYLKRRVPVAEMSEDARRRKREMWRAAARRYRDRKTSGLLPNCPPAGGDLFEDWPALGDAESPRRDLDRCTRSALRDHRDLTCVCNVTCTTDYSKHLECACSGPAPPGSVRLEAECSGEYNGESLTVLGGCEFRPPRSSCLMHPQNFSKMASTDTVCTVTVVDPLGPPTAQGVESASWYLGDIVKTLPPCNLRVTRHLNRLNLTWDVNNYMDACLRYRVRIRDPTKVRSFEGTNQYLEMDASDLRPNSRSQADVQACPCTDWHILGPWSAWSPTVDIMEVLSPEGGESNLVLYVAIPALLCVIGLCYLSKPFCMKKVQFLMFIPDPSPFFKPLHDKYDGNFKEWVHPTFSEAEVLMVSPAPVPASDQKLLLRSHRGNQTTKRHVQGEEEEEEEEEEEGGGGGGGYGDQGCQQGEPICVHRGALPGHLSLHMVVLSGCESDEGPPELQGCAGAGPGEAHGGGMGDGEAGPPAAEEGGPTEGRGSAGSTSARGPWQDVAPVLPPSPGGLEPWDDDYPRVDLDTVDSGFGESDCSSPVCSESAIVEAGFFPPQEDSAKSNYVRQWMMSQQHPPPTQQHPPPPATHNGNHEP